MVMFVYVAIIMVVYTYVLWAFIDPGLAKKSLAMAEEGLVKKGAPQAAIDAGMAFTAKIMKPGIMAFLSIFGTMIGGLILSLLVSIFIKKEGNPLIDTPAN
jgi:Sec-independent protein secretion pathway component TatC